MFSNKAQGINFTSFKDALTSNTIFSKIAFVIFILVVFLIILRLGSFFLIWMFSPSKNPTIINGMVDAKHMLVFPQDPSLDNSKPILRSNNHFQGLQFTWSVWIFIDDIHYKENQYKHIFHKGNDNIDLVNESNYGVNFPNNGPGLYITPNSNELLIIMNTFENVVEKINVPNIPLNKWLNVIIRVSEQQLLDVYINGTLSKRHKLNSVPKQNYGDIYVAMNGGFSGFISELKYYHNALGTNAIQNIVESGPNLALKKNTSLYASKPKYLSTRWYTAGNLTGYNP